MTEYYLNCCESSSSSGIPCVENGCAFCSFTPYQFKLVIADDELFCSSLNGTYYYNKTDLSCIWNRVDSIGEPDFIEISDASTLICIIVVGSVSLHLSGTANCTEPQTLTPFGGSCQYDFTGSATLVPVFGEGCSSSSSSSSSSSILIDCCPDDPLPTTLFASVNVNVDFDLCPCVDGTTIPIQLDWDGDSWVGSAPYGSCGFTLDLDLTCPAGSWLLVFSFSNLCCSSSEVPVSSSCNPFELVFAWSCGSCCDAGSVENLICTITE